MVRCLSLAALVAVSLGCSEEPAGPLPAVGQELSTVPGVSIRRLEGLGSTSYSRGLGTVEAEKADLFEVLAFACPDGLPLFDQSALPEGPYDVSVKPASGQSNPWPLLVEAYQRAFGVHIAREKRALEVYVLGRAPEDPSIVPSGINQSNSAGSHSWSLSDKGYTFYCQTMDDLADFLARQLQDYVVNETGLEGEYNFVLQKSLFQDVDLPRAVEKLGLTLKRARRPVEAYFVEGAAGPGDHHRYRASRGSGPPWELAEKPVGRALGTRNDD